MVESQFLLLLLNATHLDKAAADLVAAKGSALVVCGINDPSVQVVVNALNSLLGSYGSTIDLDTPVNFRQGNDIAMNEFVDEVKGGKVDSSYFLRVLTRFTITHVVLNWLLLFQK